MNVPQFVSSIRNNSIAGAFAKSWDILDRFTSPMCSISGGADSDVMLDIIHKLDDSRKVRYVWFNTGLEYSATKRHLDFLERKYSITIERVPAIKSIPVCAKEFGQPFISKFVSQCISQLQRHGFDWTLRDYSEQVRQFTEAKGGVEWWHNKHRINQWNIAYNKHLREFLIAYPPQFRISDKCCTYAKKRVAQHFIRDNNIDLQITGIRKAEGGIRAITNTCFTYSEKNGNIFRPIFWFNDDDKHEYERLFDVTHSDCYKVGMCWVSIQP